MGFLSGLGAMEEAISKLYAKFKEEKVQKGFKTLVFDEVKVVS